MSQTHKNYVSNTGARILRIIKLLAGHALDGVSNSELAKALGEPPSAITRAIATLIDEGFAVKLENGRFALSVAFLAIAQKTTNELAQGGDRISELTQRIAAGARQ